MTNLIMSFLKALTINSDFNNFLRRIFIPDIRLSNKKYLKPKPNDW